MKKVIIIAVVALLLTSAIVYIERPIKAEAFITQCQGQCDQPNQNFPRPPVVVTSDTKVRSSTSGMRVRWDVVAFFKARKAHLEK